MNPRTNETISVVGTNRCPIVVALATVLSIALLGESSEASAISLALQQSPYKTVLEQGHLGRLSRMETIAASTSHWAPQASRELSNFQTRRQQFFNSPLFQQQEAFFARALDLGLTSGVPRPQGLDLLLVPDETGQLMDSAAIDYLRFRQEIGGARFDFYHPVIAPILRAFPAEPETLTPTFEPTVPPTVVCCCLCPIPPDRPVNSGEPTTEPSPQLPIPEPWSVLIWSAILLSAGFGFWRRRTGPEFGGSK